MSVLVDTSVWSLAFRRRAPLDSPVVRELHELVRELRARIIGCVRQEVLSGIREPSQFVGLRDRLRFFPDLETMSEDFERAAEIFNACKRNGVQGSNTDFFICAVAERLQIPILTTDRDFSLFAAHVPIKLHEPRPELYDSRGSS